MNINNHLSKIDIKILLTFVLILTILAVVSHMAKSTHTVKEKTIVKTECVIVEKTTEFRQTSFTEMVYMGFNIKLQCGAMTINRSIDGEGSSINRHLEYSNLKVGDIIYLYQEKK